MSDNKRSSGEVAAVVLFVVVMVAVVAISLWGIVEGHQRPVVLQGTIEADQVRISGKLPGRIAEFCVSEGTMVTRGDTLVVISSPEVEAKLNEAVAMESAARAQSKKVDRGGRSELVRAAKQLWESAKAQRTLAEKTYGRVCRLWADSVVTLQRKDEAEALMRSAQATERAARQEYLMAKSGAQSEDKTSAQAVADAAGDIVAQVEAILDDSHLLSPIDGQVAVIYPSEGELVGTGTPIMSIVPLDRPYVVLNVREELMPLFPMGSEFCGNVPAISAEDIPFEVFYIAPLGSFATWRATDLSGSYDMRTFEIHARPTINMGGLRPGMSVLVELSDMEVSHE